MPLSLLSLQVCWLCIPPSSARRPRPRVDGRERNCGALAPLASWASLLLRCSQSLQQPWLVGPLTDDTELTKERSHQRRNHDRREHRNFCGVCFPKSGDIRSERRRLSYYSCAARCSCTGARRSDTPDFLPPILLTKAPFSRLP